MSEWMAENNAELLLVRIPGFKKEQLKVQIDNQGNIRITGERPSDNAPRWSRFQTEHRIPANTDVSGIRARFDVNTLYITFPKLITEKPSKPPLPAPVLEPRHERNPLPTPEPEPEPKPKSAPTSPEPELKPRPALESENMKTPISEQKQQPEKISEEAEEKEVKNKEAEGKEQWDADAGKEKGACKTPAVVALPDKRRLELMARFRRPKLVVVNIVVAVMVLVAIGIYASYKLRSRDMGNEESG